MQTLFKSVPPGHPRLFIKSGEEAALRGTIEADPLLVRAVAHVTALSDRLRDVQPVERTMTGRRLLEVSRTCLKRVLCLAVAHRLTGDKQYAVRGEAEMLAAAAFKDWNPSHFLDVAEMTAALAIGYDWLYADLAPAARAIIRQAIIEKGLKPSLQGGWWVQTTNNWNQVCHGGLVLGALAVMEDEPALAAKIIGRAIQNVPAAMAEYAPDGAYPEGPMYWEYGTTYNVILLAALESVLGSDFGLSQAKGFLASSDYYLHASGPGSLFFNYSDCNEKAGIAPAMLWFAGKRENPSILWRERQELENFLATAPDPNKASHRFFPFIVIWAKAFKEIPPPAATSWTGGGRTPVGIHRSGWNTREATYVGLKGGSPGANHAHMDIGSFVMDADGVRWAVDLGMQSYHSLESKGVRLWDGQQEGQRWDVFRLSNLSHNTLVVDGRKQRVKGHAPIIASSVDSPMPHTVIDMTSVYGGQLAVARRGVGLRQDRAVLIQDEIGTLDRQTSVRWGMVTRAAVTLVDDHTALLEQDGRTLQLQVLSSADLKLAVFETAQPPREFDALNEGTCMIGFTAELPPSTQACLVVLLRPGGAGGESPVVCPLAEW